VAVFPGDLEVLDPMQDQVHPRDRGRRQVLFLAVNLAVKCTRVTAFAHNVLDRA
jgi:hypothetical protein